MKIYKLSQNNDLKSKYEIKYPKINGNQVSGLTVNNEIPIPNTNSIIGLFDSYVILDGLREVPLSDFNLTGTHYSVKGTNRINDLVKQINENKLITPLIVAVEKEGPYILEGSTRIEALFKLKTPTFPALVVIDLGGENEDMA